MIILFQEEIVNQIHNLFLIMKGFQLPQLKTNDSGTCMCVYIMDLTVQWLVVCYPPTIIQRN